MVERIAQRLGNRCCPRLKLGEGFRIARAKTFRHTVRAHGPPFVMIPLKPDLEQVLKLTVQRNVTRRQVTMIIQNWLWLSKLVIETPCRAGLQKKIIVDDSLKNILQTLPLQVPGESRSSP